MDHVLTLLCAVSVLAASGLAQTPEKEKKPRTLTVRGTGVVYAEPDQIRLAMQVNVQGESASEAMRTANTRTEEIISLLKSHGVETKDIQTGRVSVTPIYDREKRTQPPPVVGYAASNDFTALFRSKAMGKLGEFLDKAVKAGATNFGGFVYESSMQRQLEKDALVAAAGDARARAEVLARELGAAVGPVLSVAEAGMMPSPVVQDVRALSMTEAGAPVMAGEMSVTMRVDVVFELKEK
jgi:uncharacterized protein YggE